MKVLSFALLMLSCSYPNAKENDNCGAIRIAKFKGDRACAISYTFDDGFKEHYTLVALEMEKRNMRGTFWINGASVGKDTTRVTWEELKEMSESGHEISNHGWAHKNFKRHTLEEIKEDIYKNDSAIFLHTGIMPRTFCYPNNVKTPEGIEIASENRIGTRLKQRSIGSKVTPKILDEWVETLIETNDWGVGMTHGITYGYDAFINPLYFWEHLDRVNENLDKIWVGTFYEVMAYTKEHDNTLLRIDKKKNHIVVTPQCSLDKNLFVEPLTMVVDLIGHVKDIQVKQGKNSLHVEIRNKKVMFDFNPHGGPVTIYF